MRALKITLFLVTATLVQTPIVHAADHQTRKIALQPHLHHLEAPILAHHPGHLPQPNVQPLSGESFASQTSTFNLASYFISLFSHSR